MNRSNLIFPDLVLPFVCVAEMRNYFSGLGPHARAKRCLCYSCRSLGCPSSSHHVSVKDWKCYPKDMENVL